MDHLDNSEKIIGNRVKSFDELVKEVQASWSDDAWMVYEAASKSFAEEMKDEQSSSDNK